MLCDGWVVGWSMADVSLLVDEAPAPELEPVSLGRITPDVGLVVSPTWVLSGCRPRIPLESLVPKGPVLSASARPGALMVSLPVAPPGCRRRCLLALRGVCSPARAVSLADESPVALVHPAVSAVPPVRVSAPTRPGRALVSTPPAPVYADVSGLPCPVAADEVSCAASRGAVAPTASAATSAAR